MSPTPSPAQVREEGEESGAGTTPKKKKNSLGSLLGKKGATAATLTPDERAEAEMTMYLQEAVTDAKDNPLIWWKTNQACVPLTAKLACKYFCI